MFLLVIWSIFYVVVVHAVPPLGRLEGIFPVSNLALSVRHCQYVASACPSEASNEDFQFTLINGLDNGAGSYSFQSINYPTDYLGLLNSTTGTIGIVNPSNLS